jgi:NADPH-dependent 2,4-dienoyl-CoA reductase/sulfur reductase-like enzyme
MPSIAFEGRPVPFEDDDTVGVALFRAGVRTFTRSIKHHRRRGLYCMTGDCANCLVTVDGAPGVRSCVTPAVDGMHVRREGGWPSVERDVVSVTDRLHALMPVGFYYKAFVRPRLAWPVAERVIRRATGVGTLSPNAAPTRRVETNLHVDVAVVGGGIAGLSAARAAAAAGGSVVVADERRIGAMLLPGPERDAVLALAGELEALPDVRLLERHTAVGVYEGPIVPLAGPDGIVRVHAGRVVVATGAIEAHPVFPGNDVPGVFLARGAARLAATFGVRPGERVVAVVESHDGLDQLRAIVAAGAAPVAVVTPLAVPDDLREAVPELLRDARIIGVSGRRALREVELRSPRGAHRIEADALVVGMGTVPRDDLLRMGAGLPVVGAGEVVRPGCTFEEAAELVGRGSERRRLGRSGRAGDRARRRAGDRARRLRLSVRGRLAARPRSRVGRGLAIGRDPEAVHDRDDGSVPGRALLAPPRGVLLARGRALGRAGAHDREAARSAGGTGGPRGRRARDRGEADGAARAAHRGGCRHRLVGVVEASVPVRRLDRGVPRRPRTHGPDGRRHAGEVPRRR